MDVCYNKLFKLLIDKGLKKTQFGKQAGISASTLSKLSKNETVSMDVLIKICRIVNCGIDDIVDVIPKAPAMEGEGQDGQHISI